MEQCPMTLVVGAYCTEGARCLKLAEHEAAHEFEGWLCPTEDGNDDLVVVVSVPESVGGQRSGSAASAPPGGIAEEEVLDALDPGFAAMYAEHKAQRGES